MKQAIILIGGYNSLWPAYLKLARDLESLTGLQAVGVPLMPWNWWVAMHEGNATNILQKLKETVAWARRKFQADRFILVGHSAGGLIARLYLYEGPVWGQTYPDAERITAVVTLGSPHCCDRKPGDPEEPATNWFLVDMANRLVPGAFYAGRVRYVAVAGRYVQGRRPGSFKEMRAFRMYRLIGGRGDVWGDGIVPIRSAHLDGVETLVLDGVAHSGKIGHNWYGGSRAIIRRWWSEAGRPVQS